MVVDTLVFHPTVAHYLRFAATTVGRDKVLRTLQYFARFYVWYRTRTNAAAADIAPWAALRAQLTRGRKLLQAGKNLEHIKSAALAASDPKLAAAAAAGAPLLRYATIGRQLGYAGYLTLDLLLVPDALGIRPYANRALATRMRREAFRLWTGALILSVVAQTYTLRRLRARAAQIDRKDGEGVVESKRIAMERNASQLQLLSDACDLTVTTSSLGWTGFDEGAIGLAGTVSSLIGLYNQWRKTA